MKKVIVLMMVALMMLAGTASAAVQDNRIGLKEYNQIERNVSTLSEVHELLGKPDRRVLEVMDGAIVITYVYEKNLKGEKDSCIYVTFVDTIVDCMLEKGLR